MALKQLGQRLSDIGQAQLVYLQAYRALRDLYLATLLQLFGDGPARGRPAAQGVDHNLLNQLGFDLGRNKILSLLASTLIEHSVDVFFAERLSQFSGPLLGKTKRLCYLCKA